MRAPWGLTRLSLSVLTYAVSAAACATSAGLYASAVDLQRSGDQVSGLVNILGTLALYAGLLAGLASAILFVAGLYELRVVMPWAPPNIRKALSTFWNLSLLGLVALGLLAIAYLGFAIAFTFDRSQLIAVAFQAVSAVAAAIFVIALASLPFMLSSGSLRRLAVGSVLVAGVGIAGEMAIGLVNSALYGPTSSNLLTFGGLPLINLNLPFGALVAVSAGLMWMAYRRLSSRLAEPSAVVPTMPSSSQAP